MPETLVMEFMPNRPHTGRQQKSMVRQPDSSFKSATLKALLLRLNFDSLH
jgi:hypothetical protein